MRIRSAHTLVFTRQEDEIAAFNYLSGTSFCCSPDLLGLLISLRDWTDFDGVLARCGSAATVAELLSINALVEEGSPRDLAEVEFTSSWHWGVPAALFHFSLIDREVLSIEAGEDLQLAKAKETQQPQLSFVSALEHNIVLPPALNDNELLQLMARRRTIRTAAPVSIPLRHLTDCLFAGVGITGSTKNCVGELPLSMTPSGGARNPYEAYVYARSVDGLAPGFYHYMAQAHCLTPIDYTDAIPPSDLLGGQEWTNDMPCIIFLCAWFERTMWKYDDANAYRVVLIEAGHIGQNIMLAATHHGLSACPTAALNHSKINEHLIPEARLTHSPIYALALGRPMNAEKSALAT